MAVVWAKQAGNWSTASIWAFWNETTQSVEDYGQVPQNGDVVYLNSHVVQWNTSIDLGNGEIRNDANPYTLLGGGYLQDNTATASRSLTANLIGSNQATFISCTQGNTRKTINITGNATNARITSRFTTLTINGNVTDCIINPISSLQNVGSLDCSVTINGNVTQNINQYCVNVTGNTQRTSTLIINGNVTFNVTNFFNSNDGTKNVYISGILTNNAQTYFSAVALNVMGMYGRYDSQYSYWFASTVTRLYVNSSTQLQFTDQNNVPYVLTSYPFIPDYPAVTDVKKDVVYDFGNKVGVLEQVINQVGCVTKEDVREGVPLLGMYEDGQQVVGTIIIPTEEDVREGVHYDNNKVGTLIVQGGGDRLRIADFGYYTNAQSDTYIVDLTEQDKPKFAVAEERVLIEMFPDLDLDNIPEKYFDDLFVKYLKYRLIVEYYRTAGINSTFTPSEPTTEIVNYQNVRNEVWINSANIYLKAWAKKYPESIMKPQRILL